MGSWPAHLFLLLLCLVLLAGAAALQTAPPLSADRWARPGCRSKCGNVSIPYPFGIDPGCFRTGFEINCTNSTAYLGQGPGHNIEVVDILQGTPYLQSTLVVNHYIARDCYYQNGSRSESNVPSINIIGLPNYKFSRDRNSFVAVGCDALGYIWSHRRSTFWTGCLSYCTDASFVPNGTCSGIGCCTAPIPMDLRNFSLQVDSFYNHSNSRFAPCSYAFLADVGKLNFDLSDFTEYETRKTAPVTLDWAIMNKTCEEAKGSDDFACVSPKSVCWNSNNGPGYLCNCSQGFQGNPYLNDSNGCSDINECSPDTSPCVKRCHNREGSYSCSCPWYMYGDGRRDGSGCRSILRILYLSLGVGLSLFFLIAIGSWLYWIHKKRKLGELKQHFFEKNGGSLRPDIRLFSSEELEAASDNYNQSRILGEGGAGTVYRGVLPNQNVIAIKKAKISNDEAEVQQFINEVEVLSSINHRNVVKLLGCCLESQVPMLVYEFVPNGTLAHHVHDEGHRGSLSLDARLRISSEVAGALSYLHSAASTPVIHRDVKTTNILLDHNLTAKVSDFGASRLVPLDQNGLVSLVRGTFGYLDPEYFQTGEFTDKSDVYSFGVVLVELLTGKKPVAKTQAVKNLATLFMDCVNSGRLVEILEERVVDEGTPELLEAAAELAMRCLSLKRNDRPLMREVAMELEALTRWKKHPWGNVDVEEGDSLLAKVGSSSPSVLHDSANSSMEPMVPFEIVR
ncbi:wall-associated receptor kinase 2-like [Zingiber officinale]|uniref:wall-associated receptor kinase 2-like n=1 Tax=Zingiber officinale TaxID=94328 RepID=UPI001C4C01E3|nr:wall-associated receptor kinase 2-like [Zingiber officinale]